jgi:hypothetical protein
MFVGNCRAGKSTGSNQLILHELYVDIPIKADQWSDPVTRQFPDVGPFKYRAFSRIHGIQLPIGPDPDVFVVDCEGVAILGETTAALKQATFTLAYMTNIIVYVIKDQRKPQHVNDVRTQFMLSRGLTRKLSGFLIGTTIMTREVGVRFPKRHKPSIAEKKEKRIKADDARRERIITIMKNAHVALSEEDLLILALSTVNEEELFWKSLEAFLLFTAGIASRRKNISVAQLLHFFNAAKGPIMTIGDS